VNRALALQAIGILLVALGLGMLAPWAGVVALGALTLTLGVAAEFEAGRSDRGPR
jgi:hypothetical protein